MYRPKLSKSLNSPHENMRRSSNFIMKKILKELKPEFNIKPILNTKPETEKKELA